MISDPLEQMIANGVLAVPLLAFSILALTVGAVSTIRTGRLGGRLLLLAGAMIWPLPDRPLLGPVIVKLSYAHGLHLTDLLSAAALGLAVLRPWDGGARQRPKLNDL